MTSRENFLTAMNILGEFFRQPLTEGALEGYWIAVGNVSDAQMNTAVTRALRESKFLPSGAELIAFAGVARNLDGEIAAEWEKVRRDIDRIDYTGSPDFGTRTNAVVRNLGGWQRLCALGLTALDVWARKEFERVYRAFADVPEDRLIGARRIGMPDIVRMLRC